MSFAGAEPTIQHGNTIQPPVTAETALRCWVARPPARALVGRCGSPRSPRRRWIGACRADAGLARGRGRSERRCGRSDHRRARVQRRSAASVNRVLSFSAPRSAGVKIAAAVAAALTTPVTALRRSLGHKTRVAGSRLLARSVDQPGRVCRPLSRLHPGRACGCRGVLPGGCVRAGDDRAHRAVRHLRCCRHVTMREAKPPRADDRHLVLVLGLALSACGPLHPSQNPRPNSSRARLWPICSASALAANDSPAAIARLADSPTRRCKSASRSTSPAVSARSRSAAAAAISSSSPDSCTSVFAGTAIHLLRITIVH